MENILDNTNRNFKGQQQNEVVGAFCRKHWLTLLPHFFGFVFMIALVLGYFLYAEALKETFSPIIAPIIVISVTYYLHYFFLSVFNYYLQTIIITNFRVIQLHQTLFFTNMRDSLDLREIQNIEVKQRGIFKTLFNYGELIITLSSAHATKVFMNIPNPEYHFRKIHKTKREYIAIRQRDKGGLSDKLNEPYNMPTVSNPFPLIEKE